MRGEREERGARWAPARAFGPERARGRPGERAGQVARVRGLRKEGSWASRERAGPQRGGGEAGRAQVKEGSGPRKESGRAGFGLG